MRIGKEIVPVLVFLSLIVKIFADTNCYTSASYKATKDKHSCILSQPNWAPETHFQVTHKHCLKNPTVTVFIRNFHGVDEINMDFNKKFSRWKGQSFNGKTYQIVLQFSQFKANPKYGSREQLQLKFIFVPIFGKPITDHLLTAVFDADDRSDCIWAEKLEIHDQVFLGAGLCLGFALIVIAAACYRRYKGQHGRYQATPSTVKIPLT